MEANSTKCQHCQKPLQGSCGDLQICVCCQKGVEGSKKPKEMLVSPCKIRMKSEWAHCQPKDLIYEKIESSLEIQELNDDKDGE